MWAVEADRAGWRLVPQPRTGFAVWACPDHNGIPVEDAAAIYVWQVDVVDG
jgi:hypothetical protein